jgi:hypothetical protein
VPLVAASAGIVVCFIIGFCYYRRHHIAEGATEVPVVRQVSACSSAALSSWCSSCSSCFLVMADRPCFGTVQDKHGNVTSELYEKDLHAHKVRPTHLTVAQFSQPSEPHLSCTPTRRRSAVRARLGDDVVTAAARTRQKATWRSSTPSARPTRRCVRHACVYMIVLRPSTCRELWHA